jgi:hypothetical protein
MHCWEGATGLSEYLVFEATTTRSLKPQGGFDVNHIVAISRQDNLGALAATVRTAHAGVTLAATNLIEHALKAGDALIAEQRGELAHAIAAE